MYVLLGEVARALSAKIALMSLELSTKRSILSLRTMTFPDVSVKNVVFPGSLRREIPEKETVSFTGSSHVRSRNPSSRSKENSSNVGGVKSAVCIETGKELFTSISSRGLLAISRTDAPSIEM